MMRASAATGSASHHEPAVSDLFVGAVPTQMYVQHFRPPASGLTGQTPVIMIHGGSHSGVCWTSTPDGRPGWAFDFLAAGRQVYVVDWPGVGRSGVWPDSLNIGPEIIVDLIVALLEKTGPAVLVGHSIGGTLAFKVTEKRPDLVRAVVGVSIGAVELPLPEARPAPLDALIGPLPQPFIVERFANATAFPHDSLDAYMASFQPMSPRMLNAISTVTDELKLDKTRLEVWGAVPVLFLDSEEDNTALPERTAVTADLIGAQQIMLGRDWGMAGHGHMSILEYGSDLIATRVLEWLKDK